MWQTLQDGYEENEISENENEVAEEICELLKSYELETIEENHTLLIHGNEMLVEDMAYAYK